MNELENGLEIDGRLVIEGIKAGKKSGAGVFWDLIFSLDQAHENGEYEQPDSFLRQYPDFVHPIETGEDYIRYELTNARTVYRLWNKIYKAAAETKNQIGLDEMMEWGKAFADYYSEFRIALENQKNFLRCHLPALEEIKDLKAELERAKTSPEIVSKLDNLAVLVSSVFELQKANATAAETAEKRIQKASMALDQKRKEMEVPIFKAASIIADEAKKLKIHHYCQRGAYISISSNERNIKNWEAKRNPCPWPDGFPSRWQPEEDFRIYVRRGLEEYIEQILEGRREREAAKMKENLEKFNGISIDNPPKRYKAIIDQAMRDPNLDENDNPTYAYFDEKEEETAVEDIDDGGAMMNNQDG